MISKLCLSLKSLKNIDLIELSNRVQKIELRLDNISIDDIDIELLVKYYSQIILKIININQLEEIKLKFKPADLTNKLLYDIEYNDIIMLISENHKILDKTSLIISQHNVKYSDIINIMEQIILLNKLDNIHYYKVVINDDTINYEQNIISDLYNKYKNLLYRLVLFFEGEKYTLSRYHSLILGSPLFYCALDESNKTGIGQPTLSEAIRMINLLRCFNENINSN